MQLIVQIIKMYYFFHLIQILVFYLYDNYNILIYFSLLIELNNYD